MVDDGLLILGLDFWVFPDDTPSFTNFLGYGNGERSEQVGKRRHCLAFDKKKSRGPKFSTFLGYWAHLLARDPTFNQ